MWAAITIAVSNAKFSSIDLAIMGCVFSIVFIAVKTSAREEKEAMLGMKLIAGLGVLLLLFRFVNQFL